MSQSLPESKPESNFDLPLGGRYQIISQLGAGGFGQTFLVQDLHLPGHPRCVLKKLLPQKSEGEHLEMARRLFDTEAKVLYQLGIHDQIPRLLAHFEQNQEFYLAQEFIEGEPLSKELVDSKPWSQEQVLLLLQDILQVLAFVHEQQVIHRDIKPANLIRRRQDGKIVLIDFGAVKQVSTQWVNFESGQTDMTISIGTQGFIPNEQLAGKPRFASDVYAVGIIGIWTLTGIHPKHLKEDIRTGELSWQAHAGGVNPELLAVLECMVRYDFRDRYPTAVEALEALRHLPNDLIGTLPPPLPMPQPMAESTQRESPTLPTALGMVEAEPDLEPTSLWHHHDSTTQTLTVTGKTDVLSPTSQTQTPASSVPTSAADPVSSPNQNGTAHTVAAPPAPSKGILRFWRELIVIAVGGSAAVVLLVQKLPIILQPEETLIAPVQSMSGSLIELFPEQKSLELVQEGNRLRDARQYEAALARYNQALQLRSNLAEAYWGRCYVLNAMGQPSEAIVACDDALAINPRYTEAIIGRGKALEQQQRYIEALRLYDRATAIDPDLAGGWIAQGIVLQKLGRSAEALTSLERGITLNRNSAEAWSARAFALWNLRRYNEAIAALDKTLQLNPDDQNALLLRQKARDELNR